MNTRKDYVDYIKAIGIILVVLGHINYANTGIKYWIYAFHMPLFFFATGLTIKRIEAASVHAVGTWLLKKIKALLIPYLLWGFLYAGFTFDNAACILYGSYRSIAKADSLTSLWFLPVMFVAICLVQAVLWLAEKVNRILIPLFMIGTFALGVSLPAIRYGYPFGLNISLVASAFILFGYCFEHCASEYPEQSIRGNVVVSVFGFFGTLLYHFNPIHSEDYILMADMRIGNPLWFLIVAISGCVMTYGLAKILDKKALLYKELSFIGKNTLIIFAIQKPIISVFGFAFKICALPQSVELIIACLGTLIIACAGCLVIHYFAPCLSGQSISIQRKVKQ